MQKYVKAIFLSYFYITLKIIYIKIRNSYDRRLERRMDLYFLNRLSTSHDVDIYDNLTNNPIIKDVY